MNIDSIRSLLLAIELGSLSATGAQLGVPPSTISRRVKELEADLGTRLLVRSGRGVHPAEEAHDTILRLREVLLAVEACHAPRAGLTRLRVTAPLEMTISLLPNIIPAFQKSFPDIVVELQGDDRLVGLIEADFDLAIRTGPLEDSNLIGREISSDGMVLVASPKLVAKITSLKMLTSTPIIEVSGPPPGISGHWKGKPFDAYSPVAIRLNTFTAAIPSLLAGAGYAQIPTYLVNSYIASGLLTQITQVQLLKRGVSVLYPQRHRNQRGIDAFISAVEASLISSTT